MKLLIIAILTLPICVPAQDLGNSSELNNKIKPRYPLENGLIRYIISGDATGEAELHFDRNGWRTVERKSLSIQRYGITSTESTIELMDGDYRYQVNVDAGKGKKTTDKSWSGLLGYRSHEEAITAIMTSKGGTISREDSLLNKPCKIWTFTSGPTQEIWEWNGMPLKVIKKLPGLAYEMTASEIAPIDSISYELLALPEAVVWGN